MSRSRGMAGKQPPEPLFQGHLSKRPLAHVLVYVLERELGGTLAVWRDPDAQGRVPRGQDRIGFRQGVPVSARFLDPASGLEEGLVSLTERRQAPYAFYEANLVGNGSQVIEGTIDPISAVTKLVRAGISDAQIDRLLAKLGNARLQFRARLSSDRFPLEPREQALVDRLRSGPVTARELVDREDDASMARHVLYLLALTKCVERVPGAEPQATPAAVGASPPPSGAQASGSEAPARQSAAEETANIQPSGPQHPPEPPAELDADQRARWQEVVERAFAIEKQNYFEMLDIPRDAKTSDVQKAYLAEVKRWHPDRLSHALQPLQPWAQRIFHHLTEAKNTLEDEEKRAEYHKAVQEGVGTPEAQRQVETIIGAAMEFQKVEVLARKHAWDEALELLAKLIEINDQEADFHAMRAWILFHKHGIADEGNTEQILEALDRALSLNEHNDRAHYTKGLVLKRLGEGERAVGHFRRVVELNPRHIEAHREVRLADMRAQKKAAEHTTSRESFLSRLFGDKKK